MSSTPALRQVTRLLLILVASDAAAGVDACICGRATLSALAEDRPEAESSKRSARGRATELVSARCSDVAWLVHAYCGRGARVAALLSERQRGCAQGRRQPRERPYFRAARIRQSGSALSLDSSVVQQERVIDPVRALGIPLEAAVIAVDDAVGDELNGVGLAAVSETSASKSWLRARGCISQASLGRGLPKPVRSWSCMRGGDGRRARGVTRVVRSGALMPWSRYRVCRRGMVGDRAFRTEVCVVGAGPAGLVLALLLQQSRISCIVLERLSRDAFRRVAGAGLIEHRTVQLLEPHGLAEPILLCWLVRKR